jgi:hypothetical protein
METSELLQSLKSQGQRLIGESARPDDLAKGMGLALLALEELLRPDGSSEAADTVQTAAGTFKAKANRW